MKKDLLFRSTCTNFGFQPKVGCVSTIKINKIYFVLSSTFTTFVPK